MQHLLDPAAGRLLAALRPLAGYAQRTRAKLDPTSPGAEGRYRHLRDVELALSAAADYHQAVARLLTPPPPSALQQRVGRLLAFHADPQPLTAAKLAAHFPPLTPAPSGL